MNQALPKYHQFVRIYYRARATAFAALFLAIAMHIWGQAYGTVAWGLLVAQFLVYPHLLFLRARATENSLKAERENLLLDCFLVGIWAAALGFPVWIAFTMILGTALNNAINAGGRGALLALLAHASGALLWVVVAGFRFSPDTTPAVTALCLAGLSVYVLSLGTIVFTQYRKLRDTREALRRGEERFRLITENAGDLIALVDAQGRFVYASPSYRRLLAADALKEGADALAHVQADDRQPMRELLHRVILTGESQAFPYRLTGTDGSAREFEATVKSRSYAGVAQAVVVSRDVTELRQQDRKLAVQAHAFDNMAEAMMIVSAEGIILSVNLAFATITGYETDEVIGKPESEFRTALQPAEYYDTIANTLQSEGHWSGTSWCRRKDSSLYREWRSISAIRDKAGKVTHYIAIFRISSEQPRSEHASTHRGSRKAS